MPSQYLYDHGQQKWTAVDESQVAQAVASGQFQFASGRAIPAFDFEGQPVLIKAEDATSAFRNGYQYRSPQQTSQFLDERSRQLQIEAQDTPMGQIAAPVLGAARSLTLGGSDLAIRAIYGQEGVDAVRANQEANPMLTAAGELGGAVATFGAGAPAAVTQGLARVGARIGGLTGARWGARLAASPLSLSSGVARGALSAGEAVAGGAAGAGETIARIGARIGAPTFGQALGTTARVLGESQIGQAALKYGTAGAIEGAAMGAQQSITQYALDPEQATIENTIANIGLNAVLGAGMGFGLAGVGMTARQLGAAGLDYAQNKAGGVGLRGLIKKVYPALYSRIKGLTGEDAEVMRKFFQDEQLAKRAFTALDNPDGTLDNLENALSRTQKASRAIADRLDAERQAVIGTTDQGVRLANKVEPLPRGELMAEVRRGVTSIEDAFAPVVAEIKESPTLLGGHQAAVIGQTLKRLRRVTADATAPSEIHQVLRREMKLVMDRQKEFARAGKEFSAVKDFREELRKLTTDEAIWGEAGKRYNEMSGLFARFTKARNFLYGDGRKAGAFTERNPLTEQIEISRAKIQSALQKSAQEKGKPVLAAVKEFADATDDISRHLNDPRSLLPQGFDASELQQMIDSAKDVVNGVFEAKAQSILFRRHQSVTGATLQSPMLGAALGGAGMLFGPTAAGVLATGGTAFGMALSNPVLMARYAHGVAAANQHMAVKMIGSVREFLSRPAVSRRIAQSATMGSAYTMSRAAKAFGTPRRKGEDDVAYLTRAVQQYAGRPFQTEERVRSAQWGMAPTYPEAYYPMVNVTQRAADFLATKLPPLSESPFQALQNETMSVGQQAALHSYVEAVFKPAKILDELREGTLKTETVEAVKTVYPEFYAELTGKIMDDLASRKKPLEYHQALDLAVLLGRPLTYDLANLDAAQDAVAAARAAEPEQRSANPRQTSRSSELAMTQSAGFQYRRMS